MDAFSTVLSRQATDAFGTTVNEPAAESAAPFGFGGQFGYYADEETGLVLCTHRYYSTKLGRWMTRDPIGYMLETMRTPMHIVAVSGLFFHADGRVLLVQTERRGWECPGGQVEIGEDLEAALLREVQEETGCVVAIDRLVGVYTNPTPPSKVMFHFVGRHTGGQPTQSDELAAGWFTVDEALERVTFGPNRQKLEDALSGAERPVYRVYTVRPYEPGKYTRW
jgi:8-oxo-dGTP diphosphatase